MFVQDQDFELTELKFTTQVDDRKQAKVRASFKNFGEDKVVVFDLIRGEAGWMIDEMRAGCQSLSDLYRHEYCE